MDKVKLILLCIFILTQFSLFGNSIDKKINELINAGIMEYKRKNYHTAINIWKKVLDIDPNNEKVIKYINRAKYKLENKNMNQLDIKIRGRKLHELHKNLFMFGIGIYYGYPVYGISLRTYIKLDHYLYLNFGFLENTKYRQAGSLINHIDLNYISKYLLYLKKLNIFLHTINYGLGLKYISLTKNKQNFSFHLIVGYSIYSKLFNIPYEIYINLNPGILIKRMNNSYFYYDIQLGIIFSIF